MTNISPSVSPRSYSPRFTVHNLHVNPPLSMQHINFPGQTNSSLTGNESYPLRLAFIILGIAYERSL